jgi:hypothetical protein
MKISGGCPVCNFYIKLPTTAEPDDYVIDTKLIRNHHSLCIGGESSPPNP